MRTRRRCWLGITFALVALAAMPVAGSAEAKVVFNRSSSADPDTLDPHKSNGNTASVILADLFLGLMTTDGTGEIVPGAAESHAVSADGLVYTFKLREGLTWSDGAPLTAEDFVYSFRRVQDPATAARYAQWFWSVKNAQAVNKGEAKPEDLGVRAVDARTLEVTLAAPSPIFLEIQATIMGYPVPRHVIDKHGDAWTAAGTHVSNGAYMLTERIPQTRVTAAKNPRFYDAANIQIDEVNYFPTDNLGTALNRFRAMEIDVALNFPPEQIGWLKENMPKELRIAPNLGVYYFLINQKKPPYDDIRVRKALSAAIDREGMVAKLFDTGVMPAYNLVPAVVPGYTIAKADIAGKPMPERIAMAKKLLAEAGYGPDKPLTVALQFDTLEENRRMAVAIAAMWKGIGVNAELNNSEFRDIQRRARTGEYEVMRFAYFSPFADASSYLNLYRSSDISNYAGFANAEYDALMEQANREIDLAKRAALMNQAEQILMNDYAIMPIYYYAARRLVHQYVEGWIDNPRNVNQARYLRINRPAG